MRKTDSNKMKYIESIAKELETTIEEVVEARKELAQDYLRYVKESRPILACETLEEGLDSSLFENKEDFYEEVEKAKG